MATEIERKFLVSGQLPGGDDTNIVQCYLSLDPERTVRVRIENGDATLTIKGKTTGVSRPEFEYAIPTDEAEELMELAAGSAIEKTRRRVPAGEFTWEIDTFRGANEGLVVAEIELPAEEAKFDRPTWLGEEVSGDFRYQNSNLCQHPWTDWNHEPATG